MRLHTSPTSHMLKFSSCILNVVKRSVSERLRDTDGACTEVCASVCKRVFVCKQRLHFGSRTCQPVDFNSTHPGFLTHSLSLVHPFPHV